jgi:hypothetical protein
MGGEEHGRREGCEGKERGRKDEEMLRKHSKKRLGEWKGVEHVEGEEDKEKLTGRGIEGVLWMEKRRAEGGRGGEWGVKRAVRSAGEDCERAQGTEMG